MTIIKKPTFPEDLDKRGDLDMSSVDICPSPYSDFRSGASWRIFRIMAEFIEGFEFLADLKKEVTFFGSARTKPTERWYKEARKLALMLGRAGFTIITGGGPGIMEAGNRGAVEAGAVSVGLNIQLPNEQRVNRYVRRPKAFYYFFTRKVMLSVSSQAYIYFPGGFGTIDEFSEIITLIQTKKMCPIPVVCVGKDYWTGFVEWAKSQMVPQGYIHAEDVNLFHIVDTAEEAFEIIKTSTERVHF
jgi:uncharacterized protein (TIGR00730 family)